MTRIKILSIICNIPDEEDQDEIFLKLNDKKIWPAKSKFERIGVDDKLDIKLAGKFNGSTLALELWDYDYTSRNDHLGTFHLELNEPPGNYGTILTPNDDVTDHADYMLNWTLLPD